MDPDQERERLGIPEYPVGTRFKRQSDWAYLVVVDRSGYTRRREDKVDFVRVVGGESRTCGYVYKCREESTGEMVEVYGDELGREYEVIGA